MYTKSGYIGLAVNPLGLGMQGFGPFLPCISGPPYQQDRPMRINSQRVAERMEERGITIQDLRRRTNGKSWKNMARLLRGQTKMAAFDIMGDVMRELEMSPNEFLIDREDREWPRSQKLFDRVFGQR